MLFKNAKHRQARRNFKDFVRWLSELNDDYRDNLIAMCYRESQVRELVQYFSSLSADQQYDSLLRIGFSNEQAEQAIAKPEFASSERRFADPAREHDSDQLELDAKDHLGNSSSLIPPRAIRKRIEINSTGNF